MKKARNVVIDHISLGVPDLARSIAFYDATLEPLGFARVWTDGEAAGYGKPGGEDGFAIKASTETGLPSAPRSHVAFAAPDREAVAGFHRAAVSHGATDEGEPGLHPEYGPGYFAAFVRDPDGHRLEAVVHERATSLINK